MRFIYFEGPDEQMCGLSDAEMPCAYCGRMARAFALDVADCREPLPSGTAASPAQAAKWDRREGRHGCYDCLRSGRFEFTHATEVGFLLSPDSISPFEDDGEPPLPPASFPQSAIVELRRTPRFPIWQDEERSPWLVHCNDFMVYLGTWAPADFLRHAANGDGRGPFLEMTRPEQAGLWDFAAQDREEEHPSDWYATYYAFRCRHCGKLRGQWDNP